MNDSPVGCSSRLHEYNKENGNGDPSALSASPVAAATETPNGNMVERF